MKCAPILCLSTGAKTNIIEVDIYARDARDSEVLDMKKMALPLVLALILLLPGQALADAAKGDRGEEVRYLQWLLQKTGWLNEAPDGAFGGRTEQAVMDFQTARGLEPTGAADAALMLLLDEDRVAQDREKYGPDYYEAYSGAFAPAATASAAPAHCRTAVLRDMAYRSGCDRHIALLAREYALTASGDAAGCAEAGALWRQDIQAQFDAWTAADPQAVEEARTAWDAFFTRTHEALNAPGGDPAQAERQLLLSMKCFAGALCGIASGDLAPASGADCLQAEGAVEPADACEIWAINGGVEFFTGCAEHAPLYRNEYDLAQIGDPVEPDDWDEALAALYERWAASGDEARVRDAQAAFDAALDALDTLLEDADFAALARVRVEQAEIARLCELLRA